MGFTSQPLLITSINIFGGLALFLFAMNYLASNLQNIVGEKIEEVLRKLTNKPYKGMFVGTFVTFLTQSSSITVLTLIGLVNVGMLNLNQGMGILLGAEIGTTITAQLVTFKVEALFFPLLIIGLLMSKMVKNKYSSLGKVIFSFGLLFMGIELMKSGAAPIKNSDQAISLLGSFGTNPLFGILTGAAFTALTSSSSATTSLVVALGASNVITLPAAIALILGANIGTTFLELIAVVEMSLTAKRIAIVQALINVLGVVIMFPLLGPYAEMVSHTTDNLARQIANSHTIFNVGSSLFFLFIVGFLVKVVKKLVPGEVIKVERGTRYLDQNILNMPHIALINVNKEVKRMGDIVCRMFNDIGKLIESDDKSLADTVFLREEQVNFLEQEVSTYISKLGSYEMSMKSSQRVNQLFHTIRDIERAGDHLEKIAKYIVEYRNSKTKISKSKKYMLRYLVECRDTFKFALKAFYKEDGHSAAKVSKQVENLHRKKEKLLSNGMKLPKKEKELFANVIHHLERAAHHGENMAQTICTGV